MSDMSCTAVECGRREKNAATPSAGRLSAHCLGFRGSGSTLADAPGKLGKAGTTWLADVVALFPKHRSESPRCNRQTPVSRRCRSNPPAYGSPILRTTTLFPTLDLSDFLLNLAKTRTFPVCTFCGTLSIRLIRFLSQGLGRRYRTARPKRRMVARKIARFSKETYGQGLCGGGRRLLKARWCWFRGVRTQNDRGLGGPSFRHDPRRMDDHRLMADCHGNGTPATHGIPPPSPPASTSSADRV